MEARYRNQKTIKLSAEMADLPNVSLRDGGNTKNLRGIRFNRLLVLDRVPRYGKDAIWYCECSCGNLTTARSADLRTDHVKSCGCWNDETRKKVCSNRETHGHSKLRRITSEYSAWTGMKGRCENVKHKQFECYGGRGITICERWRKSFENFILDMGAKPHPSLSLDRIDNNGNYEPLNCRWATRTQQANNNRLCVYVTIGNDTLTISQWSKKFNRTPATIRSRATRHGITIKEAICHYMK